MAKELVAAVSFSYDANPDTIAARRNGTLGNPGKPTEADSDWVRVKAGDSVDPDKLPDKVSPAGLAARGVLIGSAEWQAVKDYAKQAGLGAAEVVERARAAMAGAKGATSFADGFAAAFGEPLIAKSKPAPPVEPVAPAAVKKGR